MGRLSSVNLIDVFNFYLAAMFMLGTLRRLQQYRTAGGLLLAAPKRWPRLLQVMRQHRTIFFTWSTLRPAALALALLIVNLIASRLLWPQAHLSLGDLRNHWYLPPLQFIAFAPMLAVDVFFLVRVGRIDQRETEQYLDKAEFWLSGWRGPVVRVLTFGYVDPRRVVSVEVRKALTEFSDLMNRNLYWMSLQIACRVLFGLVLWLTWAFLA